MADVLSALRLPSLSSPACQGNKAYGGRSYSTCSPLPDPQYGLLLGLPSNFSDSTPTGYARKGDSLPQGDAQLGLPVGAAVSAVTDWQALPQPVLHAPAGTAGGPRVLNRRCRVAVHAGAQTRRQRMHHWTAGLLQHASVLRSRIQRADQDRAPSSNGMRSCSPVVSASRASAIAHRTQVDLLQRHDSQLRCPHVIACCQLTPVAHALHASRAFESHRQGAVPLPS
jgi:hypothetical protein